MREVRRANEAFTLPELVVVLIVLTLLASLALPVISKIRARAQRAQCTANLRSLYVGTELYLQEHGAWPQFDQLPPESDPEAFAEAWITTLSPYSVPRKSWICPTIQGLLNDPDYSPLGTPRIDYTATVFDDKPGTPHRWPRQPWFIEVGDVHGNGNLIIFADGSISDLKTVVGGAGSRH